MLEQLLRKHYQIYFVDQVAAKISKYISPQQATLAAGFFGVLVPFMLFFYHQYAAIICLLLSGYFDTVDGTLARHQDKTTNAGTLFDICTDRIVEFAVIFGFYLYDPDRALLCILMLGSILLCITSFLTVGIFSSNDTTKSFYYSPGLIERAEAFIFFILMMALPSYFNLLAILFITLVLITSVIRIHEFVKS